MALVCVDLLVLSRALCESFWAGFLHIVGEYGLSSSEGCVLFVLLWLLGLWGLWF